MPIWPFKKRRRSAIKDSISPPFVDADSARPEPPPRAATDPTPTPRKDSSPIPIPRRSSKRGRRTFEDDSGTPAEPADKENVPPESLRRTRSSREDVTALPMSYRLEHSPHLRPADMERPHIPYNFHTTSQTSVQRDAGTAPGPNVLRKKRSSYESGTPNRRRSSRMRKGDPVREEEIRAMSAHSNVPKRPGEGPLRRDSKKMRSLGMKESNVSLPPPEEPGLEAMPGIVEQRGWEIGSIDIFNPRPAVRLSGTPQYVAPSSPPASAPMSPAPSRKREKMPVTRDSARKRDTIGARADDLDSSDIRALLERDAKRREKRKKDQQDKLDRKLRSEKGRARGDSDKRRREAREAEELRRSEQARQRAEEQLRAHELMKPPTYAESSDTPREPVGLGIGEGTTVAGAIETEPERDRGIAHSEAPLENPFEHPADEHMTGVESPVGDPEPVLRTAQAVRMSQASTPPLSPVHTTRNATSLSQITNAREDSETPPPGPIDETRRASQPGPERRTGAWASLFRRGGTNVRKTSGSKSPPEHSFQNTSRESVRNQPLPPQLVDTQIPLPPPRSNSNTPRRTQSKFREDLPELPISPPDSRVASPEAATAATVAASRGSPALPRPLNVPRQGSATGPETQAAGRSDTPVSPSLRGPGASMASVDSEGAWLASGASTKRHSRQSGLAQRRAEYTASYEDLGGDRDGEQFSVIPRALTQQTVSDLRKDSSAKPGASETEDSREFYDAQEDIDTETDAEGGDDPMTVHESVRRQPTIVQRTPRVKSREGLLAEYTGDPEPLSAGTGKGSLDLDSDPDLPEPQLQRATSVRVQAHRGSTGSTKILDVPSRRGSADMLGESSDPATTPKL